MKNLPSWILLGAVVIGVIVIVRSNSNSNNQAKSTPGLSSQLASGRPEDRIANWSGPSDDRGFDRISNQR